MMRLVMRWVVGMSLVWAALIGAARMVGAAVPGMMIVYNRFVPPYGDISNGYIVRDLERCTNREVRMGDHLYQFEWSPDGSRIVFSNMGSILFVSHWEEQAVQRIVRVETIENKNVSGWFPDSRHLLLSLQIDGDRDFYTVDTDDISVQQANYLTIQAVPQLLFDTDENENGGELSPNGRYLLYPVSDERGYMYRLYLRDLQSGDVTLIRDEPSAYFDGIWERDSSAFIYSYGSTYLERYSVAVGEATEFRLILPDTMEGLRFVGMDQAGKLLVSIHWLPSNPYRYYGLMRVEEDGSLEPVGCAPPDIAQFAVYP